MDRKARIIITTKKRSMSETDFESVRSILEQSLDPVDLDSSKLLSEIFNSSEGEDVSELITDCTVSRRKSGGVVISYKEDEESGMLGSVTKIMFSEKNPDFVVMMREGAVNTSLSFESGKRHISTYNTPFMPFRLCVNTISVDNRFDRHEEIDIDYLLEIRGLSTERNRLSIRVNYLD